MCGTWGAARRHNHTELRGGGLHMSTDTSTPTVRQHAWRIIEKLAEVERARDPALTPAAAVVKALETPVGKAAVEFFYHPLSYLSPAAADAEQMKLAKRRRSGFERWDEAVAVCAEAISKRENVDLQEALARVPAQYPEVWRMYIKGQP